MYDFTAFTTKELNEQRQVFKAAYFMLDFYAGVSEGTKQIRNLTFALDAEIETRKEEENAPAVPEPGGVVRMMPGVCMPAADVTNVIDVTETPAAVLAIPQNAHPGDEPIIAGPEFVEPDTAGMTRAKISGAGKATAFIAEDKKAGLVTYYKIESYWGVGRDHYNAAVNLKDKTIRIWGRYTNHVHGWKTFDRVFSLGDNAEYASYNFAYTGPILNIGAKSITISEGVQDRKRVLKLDEFINRNWDYCPERLAAERRAWCD